MINEATLRQWWHIFKDDGKLVEVRILGKFAYSGYYKNIDKLIEDIKPYEEMPDEQIYFTLNDIDEGCYGRLQCERIVKSPKQTTNDNNIIRRVWVLIDFDPVRVAGINATDEEFEFAHKKAQQVFLYLKKCGFNDPVICRSGNGYHLQFKVDMPNTDETRDLISNFLQSISLMFTDEKVDIDEAVFNAARICKLYGTTAKKGANIPERPWRMSEIVYVPDEIKVNDISLFQAVANLLPKEEPKPTLPYRGGGSNESFDLERFLNEHNVQYKKEACAKWTKYVLDHCFFNPEHKGKDAAIIQMASGAIKYTCLHSSCQQHTWQEVRQMLDPHAYDPRPTQYQQQYRPQSFAPRQQSVQQPQQPAIKQETPELGKKWFSLKDIEKINIEDIEHFKTGFTDLDKAIKGLFVGELTIVTGTNSSGKSSWLNTLMLNAIQQGWKTALWSGELRPDVLKTWIQMVALGKDFLKQTNKGYYYVPTELGQKVDEWLDGKLFLYNNEYGTKWQQILSDMQELVELGVRFFILDNLMSIDVDIFDGDNNKKQKELIDQIVNFNKQNKTHTILVAHPRKNNMLIRKNDISGSGDIGNLADNVFIIHRINKDFKKAGKELFGSSRIMFFEEKGYGNVIEVAKNRLMGAMDSLVGMFYEIESRRFKNTPDEKRVYGWRNDIGVQTNMYAEEATAKPMPAQNTTNDMPFAPPTDEEAPF